MPSKVAVILTFQDPQGNPLAGGRVDLQLQQDISAGTAGGPQVCAGPVISVTLDSTGTAFTSLWPTDVMSPAAVYFATAYTSLGQPAWKGELSVASSTASYILLEDGSGIIWLESGSPDAIFTES
jgi:hypothetical protein